MSGYGLAAGAVISAVGAGTQAYANSKNLKNQDRQAAAGIEQQGNLERQGAARVSQANAKVANSNPNGGTQDLLAQYQAALSRAAPQQAGAITDVKGGSKRYAESAASAKANVKDYADNMAKNTAITGGAQLQRISNGNEIANTASDLGLINNQSDNAQGVLKAKMAGDQANPWLIALGQTAQGAGQGLMGRGLAGGLGGSKLTTTVAPGLAAGGTDTLGGMGGSNPYLANA